MQDTYTYVEVYGDGSIDITEYLDARVVHTATFTSWVGAFGYIAWHCNNAIHVNLDAMGGVHIMANGTIDGLSTL